MTQTCKIAKRELSAYFISPIAYIVIAVYLLVSGWFFFSTFFIVGQASMRNFFSLAPFIFAFIIPAVTMRLFSEEFNTGTYEILYTMPVNRRNIILGKFCASVIFIVIMLIPTLIYAITTSIMGDLDWGPVISGYLGCILLGAGFAAIGIFASSITRNQIVAFIVGCVICYVLVLLDNILFTLPNNVINVVSYIGATSHFNNIARGIIDTRDIVYFISICFIGLYATYVSLQEKQ